VCIRARLKQPGEGFFCWHGGLRSKGSLSYGLFVSKKKTNPLQIKTSGVWVASFLERFDSSECFEQTFRTNVSNKRFEQTFRTKVSNKADPFEPKCPRLSPHLLLFQGSGCKKKLFFYFLLQKRFTFQLKCQGCQIFLDKIYQNGRKYTKLPLNYQMSIKYTKWQ
jgi:hypothetical protein